MEFTENETVYMDYPNCATVSHNLSWSHFVELLKKEDALERSLSFQSTTNEFSYTYKVRCLVISTIALQKMTPFVSPSNKGVIFNFEKLVKQERLSKWHLHNI